MEKPRTRSSSGLLTVTALHEHIGKQMDNIISNTEDIPKWMILGKTVLCQKDLVKEMFLIITDQYHASL